tara:strand:+ start:4152 stop:5195 length:1044 start_codon:yes stop_codon:yes gene_type:complete
MIVVNARFLTQKITGIQRYAIEICNMLPKIIANKKLVFVVPNETIINKLDDDKDIIVLGKLKGQLWEQLSLPAFLNKNNNPMLINFMGISPVFYKNKIMFLYDLAYRHHPEWFSYSFQKLYNLLIPISIKNTKILITDSNYVKEDIVNAYKISPSKIDVIYAAPSKKFINKNLNREKFILTVSSIDPRKNLERVIKAFNKLNSDYKLVIVGQKNKTFSNIGFSAEIMNDSIIFTGYLSDDQLVDIYNRAELFIYGSLFEGFGIPPLEAQACGCACIISNATSLPEVYQSSVEYFNPHSIDNIKNVMEEIINNKVKREKLETLGLLNLKRFNWNNSAAKLKSIIEELL